MPTVTVQMYRVPTGFITGTAQQSVLETTLVAITDDDPTLDGTEGFDPGAPQVFTTPAGTASSYQLIFDTTVIYTPAGGSVEVEVPVKIVALFFGPDVFYYIMAASGAEIAGLSAGQAIRRGAPRSGYTDIGYEDIACFAAGTLIATPDGDRAVETLGPGSLVKTLDHGDQPLRWITSTRLEPRDLCARPEFLPIRIRRGALGPGRPDRDLWLSPQHRLLLTGWRVELFFGVAEMLAPAKHLLAYPGVDVVATSRAVTYYHLIFDRHEIVTANGAAAESFFLGDRIRSTLGDAQVAELLALFPWLAERTPEPARGFTRAYEVAALGGAAV